MSLDVAERRAYVRMLAERIETENEEIEALRKQLERSR